MLHNSSNYGTVPQPILDALAVDRSPELSRAFEYSATVLCQSPRQVQLERRHPEVRKQGSILDGWYAFIGNAIHEYIEDSLKRNPDYLVEKRIIRFDKPVDDTYGPSYFRRVGAKFDCYHKPTKTLSDHKTTTTFIHGKEMKDEWFTQLIINAYFLMEEGYEVDWLVINAIYVDWRDARVKYDSTGNYPIVPSAEFRIPCPPKEECKQHYLMELEKHILAEDIPDDLLPACPPDYCWEQPAKFAVYKPGAGKATKLCNTRKECLDYIRAKGLVGYQIEQRKATRLRCEKYCNVSSVCGQFKNWQANNVVKQEEVDHETSYSNED